MEQWGWGGVKIVERNIKMGGECQRKEIKNKGKVGTGEKKRKRDCSKFHKMYIQCKGLGRLRGEGGGATQYTTNDFFIIQSSRLVLYNGIDGKHTHTHSSSFSPWLWALTHPQHRLNIFPPVTWTPDMSANRMKHPVPTVSWHDTCDTLCRSVIRRPAEKVKEKKQKTKQRHAHLQE